MAKRFLPLVELREFVPLELSSGVAGQDEDTFGDMEIMDQSKQLT